MIVLHNVIYEYFSTKYNLQYSQKVSILEHPGILFFYHVGKYG